MKPRKRKTFTVSDLGKSLGLSAMTVSRALRGLPSVRPDTREKVVALAREKGVIPPAGETPARSLPGRTVAFHFPEHLLMEHGDLPFWSRLYFLYKKHLSLWGIEAVAVDLESGAGMAALDHLPLLVMFYGPGKKGQGVLEGLRKDLMVLGVQVMGRGAMVNVEHLQALDDLADGLCRGGHRHMAILGHMPAPNPGSRHEALRRCILSREPRSRVDFIPCPYLELPLEEKDRFLAKTLARYFNEADSLPSVFFATDAHCTLMAWKFLRQTLGLGVPHQVGLAGFDRSPVYEHLEPDITRVEFRVEDLAQVAADQTYLALQAGRLQGQTVGVPATYREGRSVLPVGEMRVPSLRHVKERLFYAERLSPPSPAAKTSSKGPSIPDHPAIEEHILDAGPGRRKMVLSIPRPPGKPSTRL